MASPAHKIRRSNLQAVIWRNHGEKGTWYSVQITRGFKSDEGWRNTESLGQDDLLPAKKLLDQADTWIQHQLAADAKGRREADNVTAK